jgi:hypothetical protein
MNIISLLSTLLPIIGKIIDLLTKTPDEKIADVSKALLRYVEDIGAGLKKAKETKGDTSELERVLNRQHRISAILSSRGVRVKWDLFVSKQKKSNHLMRVPIIWHFLQKIFKESFRLALSLSIFFLKRRYNLCDGEKRSLFSDTRLPCSIWS